MYKEVFDQKMLLNYL